MNDQNTDDVIAWRRFGRDHDKPCRRPEVTTCALWPCQHANECRLEEIGRKPEPDLGGVPAAQSDAGDIADLLIESVKFRMQYRVDACLARHSGDGKAATTSSGIGISYGFAREIVRTLEHAAAEIERLRALTHPASG